MADKIRMDTNEYLLIDLLVLSSELCTFLSTFNRSKHAEFMASQYRFAPVVQLLLDYQSDDPCVNKLHLLESSFQSAAEYGQVHVIELLVPLELHIDMCSKLMRSAILSR